MRIIDITHPPQSLWIGREGENTFRPVSFECANWFITYPNATIVAYYQPYGSSDPYPLVLVEDGTKRIWHPLLNELVKGDGELQIVLMQGDTVGTSAIIPTKVDRSLISNADHPASETPAWPVKVVQDVTAQADRAEAAVEHYPQIRDGYWWVWGAEEGEWKNTEVKASGLPSGGQAGQVLVSDGHGGGVWVDWDGGGSSVIEFDDRNEYVLGYLTASENYTAANRSTASAISQYASTSIQDQDCPIPFDGVYNLMPNVETEIGHVTVTRKDVAPRMLKLENVWNVRDIGGWACDGGKIAYGKIFRGARLDNGNAPATTADLNLLASVGIKLDLDIRDTNNASHAVQIPGADYINIPLTAGYAPMINNEAALAANACKTAMQSVVDGKPIYLHCASGADRTGCICGMLEAALGVDVRDIDRDYELTSFADVEPLGTNRAGGNWLGFWAALPTDQGSAKMNVVKFLRDNGVTTTLINAFRRAMTDGTPSDVDIPTYTVTNSLTGCTTSNSAVSVDGGSAYAATITPNSGYAMTILTVTMGGTDVTSTAVSGNTVTIAEVTGAIVITAFAEQQTSYTNLVRQATAFDSNDIFNGVGYKNGYYKPGGTDANACLIGCIPYTITSDMQPTDILYIKGYTGAADANHTRMWIRRADKTGISEYTGMLSVNPIFNIEVLGTGYYKLTPKTGVHHNYNNIAYLNFSFAQPDGSGIVITKNEPIE